MIMNSHNVFKIGFFVMLALNIGVLAFTLLNRPHNRPRPGDRQVEIANRLRLNEEQRGLYFKSAKNHRTEIESIERLQRSTAEEYLQTLKEANAESARLSLLVSRYSELETEKLKITYDHFKELKSLCSNYQLKHFEDIVDEVLGSILIRSKNSPPPPRGRPR